MDFYIVIISWRDKKDEHLSSFLEQGNSTEQASQTAKRRLPKGNTIFLVNTKIVSQQNVGLIQESTL